MKTIELNTGKCYTINSTNNGKGRTTRYVAHARRMIKHLSDGSKVSSVSIDRKGHVLTTLEMYKDKPFGIIDYTLDP